MVLFIVSQLTMRHVMKRVFFRLIDYAMDKQPNSDEEKDVDEETSDTPSGLEVCSCRTMI